jgi:acylphosphatase
MVRGIVQGVGYRALVLQVARNVGVRGSVRNLEDGSVEIFAEGTDVILQKFKEKIDHKGNPEDYSRVHVAEIKETPENEFAWPSREFRRFEIDYGFEITNPYERAMLEDLELMKMSGGVLREEIGDLSEGSKFFAETTGNAFGTLFDKYDSFSRDMGEIKNSLRELKDLFADFSRRYFEKTSR